MKPQIDLNSFFLLESLYRTLNISKTAEELNMSQSAASHVLSKLREHFGDPLFVRVARGMAPTDTAKAMKAEVEAFTEKAVRVTQKPAKFDPAKAEGRITIATSDMIEIILIPALLKRLQKEAPGIQLSIRPTRGQLPKAELENGTFDMGVAGFYTQVPEGFYQSKVLETHFATAYRKNHPTIKGELKANDFYEQEHALITLVGDFEDTLVRTIGGKKRKRKIVFGSYSFTGLAWTLATTDLVLTAPVVLLNQYAKYFPIKIQKTPIETPKIEIRLVWHALTHKDPLRIWMRELIREELARITAGA